MAFISSKLCHCTPSLLQAFTLSKQPFSLLQNSQVATFNHHHSDILTKFHFVPPLSFQQQNQPFGHFSTMAISMARMPSNEWLHHHASRHDHIHTHNPLLTTTHLGSASAVSVLRETSPYSSSVVTTTTDILPIVQVSSQMQMWRELQIEAGLCSTTHISVAATSPVMAVNFSGSSYTYDKMEALCE